MIGQSKEGERSFQEGKWDEGESSEPLKCYVRTALLGCGSVSLLCWACIQVLPLPQQMLVPGQVTHLLSAS